MSTDAKWLAAHAREFLAFVVDEKLSDDQVHEWMEQHYQIPFSRQAAIEMHDYMGDEVDG